MMIGLALGWVLGIDTAILLFQLAAASLADDAIEHWADHQAPLATDGEVDPFDSIS